MISKDLFLAALSMDAYNRGYAEDINGLGGIGSKIGNAIMTSQSATASGTIGVDAGFYAASYHLQDNSIAGITTNDVIIAFRGTDDIKDFWNDFQTISGIAGFPEQFRLAAEFYQSVKDANPGKNIILTGHSLGGALAGFVASLYGEQATLYNNISFENTSDYIHHIASISDTVLDALRDAATNTAALPGIEVAIAAAKDARQWALNNFYKDGVVPDIDRDSIISMVVPGDVAQNTRLDQNTPKDQVGAQTQLENVDAVPDFTLSGVPLWAVGAAVFKMAGQSVFLGAAIGELAAKQINLHWQSFLVIKQFSEDSGYDQSWSEVYKQVVTALYDDEIAEDAGIRSNEGNGSFSFMQKMIGYSALDSGERPYGDVAIRAMFHDIDALGEFSKVLSEEFQGVFNLKDTLARTLVQFAAKMAVNDVEWKEDNVLGNVMERDRTENEFGVLQLSDDKSVLSVDVSERLWDVGNFDGMAVSDSAPPDVLRRIYASSVVDGLFDGPIGDAMRAKWGADIGVSRIYLASDPEAPKFTLPDPILLTKQSGIGLFYAPPQSSDSLQVVAGSSGDDLIISGRGSSHTVLQGGDGDDLIVGDAGETLDGGQGDDYLLSKGPGVYIGGAGDDVLDLSHSESALTLFYEPGLEAYQYDSEDGTTVNVDEKIPLIYFDYTPLSTNVSAVETIELTHFDDTFRLLNDNGLEYYSEMTVNGGLGFDTFDGRLAVGTFYEITPKSWTLVSSFSLDGDIGIENFEKLFFQSISVNFSYSSVYDDIDRESVYVEMDQATSRLNIVQGAGDSFSASSGGYTKAFAGNYAYLSLAGTDYGDDYSFDQIGAEIQIRSGTGDDSVTIKNQRLDYQYTGGHDDIYAESADVYIYTDPGASIELISRNEDGDARYVETYSVSGRGTISVHLGVAASVTVFQPEGTIYSTIFANAQNNVWVSPSADIDYIGNFGNDRITGGAGDNYLSGGTGDDIINSGGGQDRIYGGTGNDEIYATGGYKNVLHGDGGDDLIYAGDGNDYISGGSGVDRLFGEAGDDIIYGNDGDDVIFGDGAFGTPQGKDWLIGGDGDDTFYASGSHDDGDLVQGDDGFDTVIFDAERKDFKVTYLNFKSFQDTDYLITDTLGNSRYGSTQLYDVESIVFSDGEVSLKSLLDAQTTIYPVYETDGLGNNYFNYNTKGGFASFAGASNTIETLNISTGAGGRPLLIESASAYNSRTDSSIDKSNLVFSEDGTAKVATVWFDTVALQTPDSGAAIKIIGDFSDTYLRHGGELAFDLGSGDDEVDLSAALSISSYRISDAGGNLILTGMADGAINFISGSGNDRLTGGNLSDIIDGGAGDDQLKGGGGRDTLSGGRGKDDVAGGDGDDRILVYHEDGIDSVDGGAGKDYLLLSRYGSNDAFNISLADPSLKQTLADGTSIVNVEQIEFYGGDAQDTVTGGNLADVLYGNGGDDILQGAGGDDQIVGGDGNDVAVYRGRYADYAITAQADGTFRISSRADGSDAVSFVEKALFADGSFDFSTGVFASTQMPLPTIALTSATVGENSAVGTVIGRFALSDHAAEWQFSLLDDTLPLSIVGNELRVAGGVDFEATETLVIGVHAVHRLSGQQFDQNLTLRVLDVNETGTAPGFGFSTGSTNQGMLPGGPVRELGGLASIRTDDAHGALVENTGAWNALKNAFVTDWQPALGSKLTVANFVDVRLDFTAALGRDVDITAIGAKRGGVETGHGDDQVTWFFHSNDRNWVNKAVIDTGAGDDRILVSDISRTAIDDALLEGHGRNGAIWNKLYDGRFSTAEVDGGDGDDVVEADAGTFTKLFAVGGLGSDILRGGRGNDRLEGGAGNDHLTGRLGGDVFVFRKNDGDDTIADFDFAEGDRISLLGGTADDVTFAGNELLFGGTSITAANGHLFAMSDVLFA